jgi:carboxyl-terminal processing protease
MNKKDFTFTSFITVGVLILSITIPFIQSISYAEDGKFGGIGVKIAQIFDPDVESKIGPLVVLDVIKGSAASEHGVKRGDVITHINGEPTGEKAFKYLIFEKLRGRIDSKIDISIERAGVKLPINFTLTRVEIAYPAEHKK